MFEPHEAGSPRAHKWIGFAGLRVVGAIAFSLAVMWLWNGLMPGVFGVRSITFRQALELLVLSRLLFGSSLGSLGHRLHLRHHMIERWDSMTPEERERFRHGLRDHHHHHQQQYPRPDPPMPHD
jgi:hypothetical protein